MRDAAFASSSFLTLDTLRVLGPGRYRLKVYVCSHENGLGREGIARLVKEQHRVLVHGTARCPKLRQNSTAPLHGRTGPGRDFKESPEDAR